MNKLGLTVQDTPTASAKMLDTLLDAHYESIQRGLQIIQQLRTIVGSAKASMTGCGSYGSPSLQWGDALLSFDHIELTGDAANFAIAFSLPGKSIVLPVRLDPTGELTAV